MREQREPASLAFCCSIVNKSLYHGGAACMSWFNRALCLTQFEIQNLQDMKPPDRKLNLSLIEEGKVYKLKEIRTGWGTSASLSTCLPASVRISLIPFDAHVSAIARNHHKLYRLSSSVINIIRIFTCQAI